MGNMCVCIYIYIIYCVCVPVCKSPICQNVVFNTHTPPLNGIQQTLKKNYSAHFYIKNNDYMYVYFY